MGTNGVDGLYNCIVGPRMLKPNNIVSPIKPIVIINGCTRDIVPFQKSYYYFTCKYFDVKINSERDLNHRE